MVTKFSLDASKILDCLIKSWGRGAEKSCGDEIKKINNFSKRNGKADFNRGVKISVYQSFFGSLILDKRSVNKMIP